MGWDNMSRGIVLEPEVGAHDELLAVRVEPDAHVVAIGELAAEHEATDGGR